MRQLVTEGPDRVAGAGAGVAAVEDDASRLGERDRRSPLGRGRPDPGAKGLRVRRDRDQRPLPRPRQPGKGVVGERRRRQRVCEAVVLRVVDEGQPPGVQAARSGLSVRQTGVRRCDERQSEDPGGEPAGTRREARDQASRDGPPPCSTSASISAQRFPHGLNLFAANPSRHAASAASRSPLNQCARPSS